MLEAKNITKQYGKKTALEDVSVAFEPGQIVGLFGENGAGKTTLMKCILGLTRCRGTVTLTGRLWAAATSPGSASPPASTASSPGSRPRRTGIFTGNTSRNLTTSGLRP